MSNGGYIYILINASVEGLIRVGKTAGDPKDDAKELSVTTGLPAPFIVAFDAWFDDVAEAEQRICAVLDRRGYRVANNREFFSAPLNEVVKIVLDPGGQLGRCLPPDGDSHGGPAEKTEEEFLDSLSIQTKEPWEDVLEQAAACYVGFGDTLQDYAEAMKLLKQAARLGSVKAYKRIAIMYQRGEGVRANDSTALEYYKQGADKGDAGCYGEMCKLFMWSGKFENAQKCWRKFTVSDLSSLEDWEIGHYGYWYFHEAKKYNLPLENLAALRAIRDKIVTAATEMIIRFQKDGKDTSMHEVTLQQIRITLFDDVGRTGAQ